MAYKYDPLVESVGGDLDTDGTDVACDCPRCDHKKLYVNRDTGLFFCFRCEFAGRAADLIAELHGISPRSAASFVKRYTIAVTSPKADDLRRYIKSRTSTRPNEEDRKVKVTLPAGALPIKNTEGYAYLQKRGFSRTLLKPYRLLYVPASSRANGEYNPVARHVIFPCYDTDSSLVFWTSRAAFDPVVYGSKSSGPSGVKKRNVLYGIKEYMPSDSYDPIILVEGPLDMISLKRKGVSILGKYLADSHIKKILSFAKGRKIIVCLDAEEIKASWEAADRISKWSDSSLVYVSTTAPYKDAAEALKAGVDPVELIQSQSRRYTRSAYIKGIM